MGLIALFPRHNILRTRPPTCWTQNCCLAPWLDRRGQIWTFPLRPWDKPINFLTKKVAVCWKIDPQRRTYSYNLSIYLFIVIASMIVAVDTILDQMPSKNATTRSAVRSSSVVGVPKMVGHGPKVLFELRLDLAFLFPLDHVAVNFFRQLWRLYLYMFIYPEKLNQIQTVMYPPTWPLQII